VLWSLFNYGSTGVYFPIIKLRSLADREVYPYRHRARLQVQLSISRFLLLPVSSWRELLREKKKTWTAITNTFVKGNRGRSTRVVRTHSSGGASILEGQKMTFLGHETALHFVERIYEKGINVSPFTGLKISWFCQNSKCLLVNLSISTSCFTPTSNSH